MQFEIKKATRIGIVPLIALYSESGCGKTFSALLMARGLAGIDGRIIMIDSEGGRGSLYADVEEIGGYDVIELEEPYSPQRYIDAVKNAQDAGAEAVIVDSGSHEWEGVGGVLDIAAANEERSGRAGLHNWKKPKFEHAKFIQALTRATVPIIVCLRAKYKTRQGKDKGKTVIVKDDHTSPIQAEDFIFEATCHGEIMSDHKLRLTKWSHPKLKTCFPVNGMITIETGRKIQEWCQSPGGSNLVGSRAGEGTPALSKEAGFDFPDLTQEQKQPEAAPETIKDVKALKKAMWTMLQSVHNGDVNVYFKWLITHSIIEVVDEYETLTAERLGQMVDQVLIVKNEGGIK